VRFYLEPIGKTYNRWVIVQKADGAPIGTCGFHKWDKSHRRAEIGYDLSPDFWGKGFMTEALREVIRHGLSSMKLNRIEAMIYPENTRSLAVAQRLGFKQEGILRDYSRQGDRYFDHSLYSLLASD
jgi:ribosomal-protein-alanine N-acetyltransferase